MGDWEKMGRGWNDVISMCQSRFLSSATRASPVSNRAAADADDRARVDQRSGEVELVEINRFPRAKKMGLVLGGALIFLSRERE